ncbi:unnamed protein product [Sphagnum jensenii]|uniref:Exonuclease domain-containing protein n=1 Tax=Sphagnum jensenii TaxID=128206 RepID=A0ABP1C0X9_9BRYO
MSMQTVKRICKWAHCHKLEELLNATHSWPKTPEQGWIISKRERKINVPERLIALDCEMLDCEGCEAQIVKIFVVDRNCDILIDELVLPDKKVVDYLTHITGGKAEDLEGVSLTREAVQAVLRYDFRVEGKPQNCLDDAIVPMRLVLHRLEHGLEGYDITQSKRVVSISYLSRGLDNWVFVIVNWIRFVARTGLCS